jgi:hypothetical protein
MRKGLGRAGVVGPPPAWGGVPPPPQVMVRASTGSWARELPPSHLKGFPEAAARFCVSLHPVHMLKACQTVCVLWGLGVSAVINGQLVVTHWQLVGAS